MRSSFLKNPQVLVVEASAGSGKTYALAKRYVQLCLYLAATQTVPIQSILAITFTNKATWAMKSRILDFLKRIALKQLKPYEAEDILKPLGLDEKQASSLAFGIMNDVIRQYHYFQVQTIDSFVNILLIGCSFKIGLSARFKIQRNSREYLQLSLDDLLEQAHSDKEVHQYFLRILCASICSWKTAQDGFPGKTCLKSSASFSGNIIPIKNPCWFIPCVRIFFHSKERSIPACRN